MVRGWIGSFADQVYPIYAMTKFLQIYQDEGALQAAVTCAQALCQAQGQLGQWWWHYDASSGRVVDGYPVFSVHQHGMAPMTLFALGKVIERDFEPWIHKGLKWINPQNELGLNMEDSGAGVIWRCLFRPKIQFRRYFSSALNQANSGMEHQSKKGLNVLFECRPYELGWLLYAFATRVGKDSHSLLNDFRTASTMTVATSPGTESL